MDLTDDLLAFIKRIFPYLLLDLPMMVGNYNSDINFFIHLDKKQFH